jgi:hypothetical protein
MKLVGSLAALLLLLILLTFVTSPSRSHSVWNDCQGKAYDRWDACIYNCEQYPYDSDDRSWCLHSCISKLSSEYHACENQYGRK